MPTPARQACDPCRRRKIRCAGEQPCPSCRAAALHCTYLLVPRKKGRQGDSANVLTELRAAQQHSAGPGGHIEHGARPGTASEGILSPTETTISNGALEGPRRGGFAATPNLVPADLVETLTAFYLARLRSTAPVLDRGMVEQQVELMESSLQAYCFVVAFCAFVIIQTGAAAIGGGSSSSSAGGSGGAGGIPLAADLKFAQELVAEAIEARKYVDPTAAPSCRTVLVSFFLYGSQVGLGNQRRGWYYLREATTLYTSGPLHVEAGIKTDDLAVAKRLFWLLLISERAHAIRRRRPITLQVTPDTPGFDDINDDDTDTALASAPAVSGDSAPRKSGFAHLIALFRPFDDKFFALWNRSASQCSESSLAALEQQILDAVPAAAPLSDDQLANLRVSQQWLRLMLWELFTLLGYLSSTSPHACMGFRYPLQVARDLTFATWKLPIDSMEIHGVGLTEKIFDAACAVTDVLTYIPSTRTAPTSFELGPSDYLKHFTVLCSKLPGGRAKFVPLLLAKVAQQLPALSAGIVAQLPHPVGREAGAEEGGTGAGGGAGAGVGAGGGGSGVGGGALTPDSGYMYDEEVRGYLNGELSRIGMESAESGQRGSRGDRDS